MATTAVSFCLSAVQKHINQKGIEAMASLKVVAILGMVSVLAVGICEGQGKKPFTVADEIGLTLFDGPDGGDEASVEFSPDGSYFFIKGYRGDVQSNSVEDSLYIYRSQDVRTFLSRSADEVAPAPFWVIQHSSKKEGAIGGCRWLSDSSGIVLQEPTVDDNQRIVLAHLRTKKLEPLILAHAKQIVKDFDVRDRQHYIYTVAAVEDKKDGKNLEHAPAVVGTNRTLTELLFPVTATILSPTVSLWAVVDGKRFEIKHDGSPLTGFGSFSLSPDGKSLLTTMPVTDVPLSWETLYPPPPYTFSKNRIHAGHYDIENSHVHQYVRVDLETGAIQNLTDAPIADDAGWVGIGGPSWSEDGKDALLPNTFLNSKDNAPSRPCVAVVDLVTNKSTCAEILRARKNKDSVEEGFHVVWNTRFEAGDRDRLKVVFVDYQGSNFGTTEYQRASEAAWKVVSESKETSSAKSNGLEIRIKQGLNDPPVLVASKDKQACRILDPNPQLRDFEFGLADVYTWKDKQGRQWKGGLYKPANYRTGVRYPLVIQTHGFSETKFRPSGVFPAGMAARALAANGIMVLQTVAGVNGAACPHITTEEGSCVAGMVESAATQLIEEGLVDPQRIGIVGFSRTCYGAMETLTISSVHLAAALLTDGVMFDFFQYILFPERFSGEANKVIGAPPFSQEGLEVWLKRSPGFNLDKVNTPLMVVGEGPDSLLFMWQPYAGLHYLRKPVDLIMLNTDEHVLTNPAARLASQEGAVDWFRFWLKGEEGTPPSWDPDRYVRWRKLRGMQEHNQTTSADNGHSGT